MPPGAFVQTFTTNAIVGVHACMWAHSNGLVKGFHAYTPDQLKSVVRLAAGSTIAYKISATLNYTGRSYYAATEAANYVYVSINTHPCTSDDKETKKLRCTDNRNMEPRGWLIDPRGWLHTNPRQWFSRLVLCCVLVASISFGLRSLPIHCLAEKIHGLSRPQLQQWLKRFNRPSHITF